MDAIEYVQQHHEVSLALLVVAFTIIFLVVARRLVGKRSGNVVLVLGASGSGKTTLFLQLRDGALHQGTVPSMQHNADSVFLKQQQENESKTAQQVELVDVPGHPKVRGTAAEFYGRARAILFLVDAVEFMSQKTEVAEQLFEVLSDLTVQTRRVPVLLVCNKSDMGMKAHTSEFVRKRLEREIEALRGTRATLGEAEQSLSVAKKGEAFTFAGLKSPKVSIATASALANDLQDVLNFLK